MSSFRWRILGPIVSHALELDAGDRDAYLMRASAGNTALLEESRSLLADEEQARVMLESASSLEDGDQADTTTFGDRTGQAGFSSDLRAGRKVGPFLLRRYLARGGMGQVWVADDLELRRKVALKFVHPNMVDEKSLAYFSREARAGGRVNHENLVRTLAHGREGDLAWIAQELVEGSWTLRDSLDALRSTERLPRNYYRRIPELVAQVADGMQAAHDAGVIHRDLKPQNILLEGDGTPKVTDFGLAQVKGDSLQSEPGSAAGTLAYMSPEQLSRGAQTSGARSDVFSLGVVLFELLTLRRPFEGDSAQQIARAILDDDPGMATAVRSQCPRELAIIAYKALEKSPDRRYASMAEFAADLRRFLAHEPILAHPPGPLVHLSKWIRRHPALSAAILLASLALVVISALLVRLSERGTQLLEQTRIARANEEAARIGAERARLRAEEQAGLARLADRRVQEILSLSSAAELEDLVMEAELLWPPHPDLLPRMQSWLEDARETLEGRRAEPASGQLGRPSLEDHAGRLVELTELAVDVQDEEALTRAFEHPDHAHLVAARAHRTWLRRMLGIEEWPDLAVVEAALDATRRGEGIRTPALLEARRIVGPTSVRLDEVSRGWILAGVALDGARESHLPEAWMTLAWAEARLGRFEEALASAQLALESASERNFVRRDREFPDPRLEVDALHALLASWSTEELSQRQAELDGLEGRIELLRVRTGERQIEDPVLAWWHHQLDQLVVESHALHDSERGLAGESVAPPFGWGVARRAAFAAEIEERSRTSPEARALWAAARSAIRSSPHYGGLDLEPQLGLLPLGSEPDSGLHEFVDLHSGLVPQRNDQGHLILTPEMGIVLVLVPGGGVRIGAQRDDMTAWGYDPQATPGEVPVRDVQLAPYLLSKFELTQAQWQRLTGTLPSAYGSGDWDPSWSRDHPDDERMHPVENVSWRTAMRVLRRFGLDLPENAQWEHACRGGTSTPFWSGNTAQDLIGVANVADRFRADGLRRSEGMYMENAGRYEPFDDGNLVHARIGSYLANPFGLHDMHGNVSEWVRDGILPGGEALEQLALFEDSANGDTGQSILRGGDATELANMQRVTAYKVSSAGTMAADIGLRPARRIWP